MQKSQVMMTVLGLLLGAFGLVLLNFGNAPTTSTAAEDYHSTWKATSLYRLHYSKNDGTGLIDLGGIGVRQWQVTGVVAGSPFTETWTGPLANSISFSESGTGNCHVNADPKVWLGSCLKFKGGVGVGNDNYRLFEVTVDFAVREGNNSTWSYSGSGAFCQSGINFGCWSTIGTYGFQRFITDLGNLNGKPAYVGVMMPLQWDVSGTFE